VLTAVKVAAIVLLCLAALAAAPEPTGTEPGASPFQVVGSPLVVLAALVGVLWAYDGWSDLTLVAGEIERPGRNLGRAVVLGIALLVAIYCAVQVSVHTLLPQERAAASARVVSEAVTAGLGPGAGRLVAVLIVLCTLGSINGVVLAAGRLGYAMARDGAFLPWFGGVHPRWGTPARSILALVAATLAYVTSSGLRELLFLFSFNVWIFYGLTAVALVVLRRRRVGEPVPWRAPGGWLAPAVVLAVASAMISGLAWQSPVTAAKSLGLLLAGVPVWVLWRWARRGA
jgi:APA family basic amino acid/polyamine antiporter